MTTRRLRDLSLLWVLFAALAVGGCGDDDDDDGNGNGVITDGGTGDGGLTDAGEEGDGGDDGDAGEDGDAGDDGDAGEDGDGGDDGATVQLTVTNVEDVSYTFTDVQPAEFADTVGPGTEDPSLTLQPGFRYEIVNEAAASHPFELVTLGDDFSGDVVLASQVADGTLEADPEVEWEEDGDTVRFTVAGGLVDALSGYRCAAHPVDMRGAIMIATE